MQEILGAERKKNQLLKIISRHSNSEDRTEESSRYGHGNPIDIKRLYDS
jgi:hypothetical protein